MYKILEDFPNYKIYKSGDIYSMTSSRMLTPYLGKNGYMYITLIHKDGKRRTKTLHTLLATAFLDNPDNLAQVNHIDGVKHNNDLNNLEWSSPSHNVRHAFTNGLTVSIACLDYDKLEDTVEGLRYSGNWSELSVEFDTYDPSSIRKLAKRHFERIGRIKDFNEICKIVKDRIVSKNSTIIIAECVETGEKYTYPSINETARVLGANPGTIFRRLKSGKSYNGYVFSKEILKEC